LPDLSRAVRRNTLLLATTLAINSAVVQLVAAVSSLTFVLVTGVKGLLGLGPAIFLTAAALFGAALALLGGLTLETLGVGSMAVGAAILVTAPAPWLLRRRRPGRRRPFRLESATLRRRRTPLFAFSLR
jgi:hypothetical protein